MGYGFFTVCLAKVFNHIYHTTRHVIESCIYAWLIYQFICINAFNGSMKAIYATK